MCTAAVPANAPIASALEKRYRDAYVVAKGIIFIGNAVKIGGACVGGLIILFGLAAPGFMTGVMFAMGVLVGVSGFAAGILISAQGQIMQSVIDTAVNTSPQITPEQKTQVMGI
jgi:hypothetical protein